MGRAVSSQRLASQRARSQRAPSLSPSQSTFSCGAPSPPFPIGSDIEVEYLAARPLVFQPRLKVDVDVDVDVRRPGSATGPRLLESATSASGCVPSAAVAQQGSLDVVSARTHTRSDTPMPPSDISSIGQRGLARPTYVDVPRPLELTSSSVVDVAHPYAPPSVDVNRPTSVDVRRPLPTMGVRQSRSMMNADADEPSAGSSRPMRVGDEGRQGLGRPMSVDVVRQPHSSLMGVDVVRPVPTPRQSSVVDAVHPPSTGVDVTKPMPVGGVHSPSMGTGVVGPMPAHVSRQSGTTNIAYPPGSQSSIGVGVASDILRPTLADVSYQPPTWTGPKPAYASQYAAVCTGVQVQTPVETLTAQSLLLLGRRTASLQ